LLPLLPLPLCVSFTMRTRSPRAVCPPLRGVEFAFFSVVDESTWVVQASVARLESQISYQTWQA
jgi:hypothetical protein